MTLCFRRFKNPGPNRALPSSSTTGLVASATGLKGALQLPSAFAGTEMLVISRA